MKKMMCLAVMICLCMNGVGGMSEEVPSASTPQPAVESAAPEKAPSNEKTPETKAPEATKVPEPTKAPEATKVPEPTKAPESTDVPEESKQPTDTPTPTVDETTSPSPTEDDGTNPSLTPPVAGEETPSPSPDTSDAPENSPSVSPELSPTVSPSTSPDAGEEIPADAEAWMQVEGLKVGGKLEELIPMLQGNEEIYLRVGGPLLIKDAPLLRLSGVRILPDPDIFKGEKFVVRISADNPETTEVPALLNLKDFANAAETDVQDLYFWIAKETGGEDPDNPPVETGEILVEADGFEADTWLSVPPVFTLSGIPEDKDWHYAVIIYDERIAVLSENVYIPEEEGIYTVRFAILDNIGDIVDASDKYSLWLDCTPPEMVSVQADEAVSYTLHITASDAMSGVEAISVDGGQNWMEMENGGTYTYSAKKAGVLEPGMIQVRDAAGNIYESTEPYDLIKIENPGGGFWGGSSGGGGSGDGSSTTAKTHASGDGEDSGEYDALQLALPEEPMKKLTIDNVELPLTLALETAEGFDVPADHQAFFTARLAAWTQAEEDRVGTGDEAPQKDTLILEAVLDENLGDRFTYVWNFNGEVYRVLANSGIRYMTLKVGDDMAAFSTEGFTAGAKYTELKMLGVSTRKFDYAMSMKVNLDPGYVSAMTENDFSQACDLSIRTEVENMAYELSSSTQSAMYFYDVYLGPEEMMDIPFGEYTQEGH